MIPKKAFFVYGEHDQNTLGDLGLQNIADFNALNPDWDVNFITLNNSPRIYRHIFHWNKLAWSQVVRFALVYEHGGLYSDVDIMFYGAMPSMEGCETIIAVETHGDASDAFFAASPKNPMIGKLLRNAVEFCHRKMESGDEFVTTGDLFLGAGIAMFSETVKEELNVDLRFERQIHMTEEEFGGKFHPENGVGILPFEALSRHNKKNWVGWHQCWGSWRPGYSENACDMSMEAKLPCTGLLEYDATLWDTLAFESPYWAVITDPKYKVGEDASFWESGVQVSDLIRGCFDRAGIDLSKSSVTELGVGVGRIARDMVTYSESFLGLDISPEMIRVCTEKNPDINVRLVSDTLPASNVYYSHITLQHCHPITIRRYLREMMAAASKAIWFQLYDPGDAGSDFSSLPMHGISPSEVLSIGKSEGWQIETVAMDSAVGDNLDSYHYLFTKKL